MTKLQWGKMEDDPDGLISKKIIRQNLDIYILDTCILGSGFENTPKV